MAITYQSIGTTDYSTNGGSSVKPAYPASLASGDLMVLFVGQKPATANGGGVTTPSGWTLVTSKTASGGYGTTLGADTGNTNLYAYVKTATGSESGSLTVTIADNDVAWANILRYSNATGVWNVTGATGEQTTAPTSPLSVSLAPNLDVTSGDHLPVAFCIPTDVTTPSQFSSETYTESGITFGTISELVEPDSSTGNDIGGVVTTGAASSGTATAAFSFGSAITGTLTNVRGPVVALRLREATATTMPVTVGTFTLTGVDVAFPAQYKTSITVGAFTLTGQAATPAVTTTVTAGSFAVTGVAATLGAAYTLAVSAPTAPSVVTSEAGTILATESAAYLTSEVEYAGSFPFFGMDVAFVSATVTVVAVPVVAVHDVALAPSRTTSVTRTVSPVALRVSAVTPAVTRSVSRTVSPVALRLASVTPSVRRSVAVTVPRVTVRDTAFAPSVTASISRAVGPVRVRLDAVAPSVATGTQVAVSPVVLPLHAVAPSVTGRVTVAVSPVTLHLTGHAPSVTAGTLVAVPVVTLREVAQSPSISRTVTRAVDPVALRLLAVAPSAERSVTVLVSPVALALRAVSPAAAVRVTPVPSVLRLHALAPAVSGGSPPSTLFVIPKKSGD